MKEYSVTTHVYVDTTNNTMFLNVTGDHQNALVQMVNTDGTPQIYNPQDDTSSEMVLISKQNINKSCNIYTFFNQDTKVMYLFMNGSKTGVGDLTVMKDIDGMPRTY